MSKKVTTEEFIAKAKVCHNDKYDYSQAVYTGAINQISIICPIHGMFQQKAANHLQGKGCAKCGNTLSGDTQRGNTLDFIRRASILHKNKYDYSKAIYISSRRKVIITCSIHGEFTQTPDSHLSGQGCALCGYVRSTEAGRGSTDTFIKRAKEVHGDSYRYENTQYVNTIHPVIITCTVHGDFIQIPRHHISGSGCPKCKVVSIQEALRKDNSYFIQRSIYKHGNTYGYEEVQYVGCSTPVRIHCQKHGFFMQTPSKHIQGAGCPVCNSSKGELMIKNFLVNNNVVYVQEKTFSACKSINKLPFDFAVYKDTEHTQLLCLIEYDGEQHYRSIDYFGGEAYLSEVKRRDAIKNKYCVDNGIRLIRIPYWDKNKIEDILQKELV